MIDLGNGLFTEASEELIRQQNDWYEDDQCKHMDFSASPFWLTTDNGEIPEGFSSIEEIKKYVEKLRQ